jgi:hypothetical protein
MHPKKAIASRARVIAILVFLFSGSARAQAPVYHPGDVLRISVTFGGPDAGRITSAVINLTTPSVSSSQPGFKADIYPGESKQTGPNTFEVSYKIPEIQASGEYQLDQIRAVVTVGRDAPITLFYNPPADFPRKTFKIENPNTLVKPTIKDVKVP